MPTAEVHPEATLIPGKAELIAAWLPEQPWFPGGQVTQLGTFRLVDPAGEVGIETFLLDCGGVTVQLPLTYRGAELGGARLVGTMEHSLLGTRWVYDGVTDPVYAAELLRVVAAGETQAALSTGKEPTAHAQGSGTDFGDVTDLELDGQGRLCGQTDAGPVVATVARLVASLRSEDALGTLTATWSGTDGRERSAVVAVVTADDCHLD